MDYEKIKHLVFTLRYLLEHIKIAFSELSSNKLRTLLSLLGITIGVFCIISVLTVFDSLQENIESNMQSLGSNVLYVGKYAWIPEEKGEYPWWKYKARPVCNLQEMQAVRREIKSVSTAVLCYSDESQTLSYGSQELKGVNVFAVTQDFEKLQPIDIAQGRYFSMAEMNTPYSNAVVLGSEVAATLFNSLNPIGRQLTIFGRKYTVIGTMTEQGKTMTGFNFDKGIIISYRYLSAFRGIDGNIGNGFVDPMLMVKAKRGVSLDELKYEVRSVLRALRKQSPKEQDSFSFNQLDSIQKSINEIFANFNMFGWIIGLFSLVVGGFGIANIMFVSVKERTRFIGVKKAIGAKPNVILSEFLTESIILCILGGLLGILLVMLLSALLSGPLGFPVSLSSGNFLLGLGISIFVGIASGYIPAKRASKLDPVVAIRS